MADEIRLSGLEFRRLVCGRTVARTIAQHPVVIQLDDLSPREMLTAIAAAFGDDPAQASEFLRRK